MISDQDVVNVVNKATNHATYHASLARVYLGELNNANKGLRRLAAKIQRLTDIKRGGIRDGQKHYACCWAEPGHHLCAIARIKGGPDTWSVEAYWQHYLTTRPKGVKENVEAAMESGSRSETREAFLAGVRVAAHEAHREKKEAVGDAGSPGCHYVQQEPAHG